MPPTSRSLRRALAVASVAPLLALSAACSSWPAPPSPERADIATTPSSLTTPSPETMSSPTSSGTTTTSQAGPTVLLDNLDIPWSIAALPDGSALVSERNTGKVHWLPKPGTGGSPTVVGTLPIHRTAGEGGLLGLAIPPDFDVDPVFYAYYTTESDNRVAAVPWRGDSIGKPTVILDGIPNGRNHNGGRIAFGPDGYLYVATGDSGTGSLSQSMDSLGGKILRITPDGKSAPGNPFGGSRIWSLGHRNVQGLAWDASKRMYASEFGANTWDELNVIQPGGNYGWPVVEGKAGNPDYVDPIAQWRPSEMSPSGLAIGPDGAAYLAALRGQSVWRVPLTAKGKAGEPQRFLEGKYGRIRDVHFANGRVWILTSNGSTDRLLSLPGADVGLR
ncbi:MAG: PQQ-dependent sugar dehydrogenase [Micrococcales bacterium]|nr:PQQ-dependent sugar dehydrogenase [Micrococcales bacterium]